jgi:hypothetical protein
MLRSRSAPRAIVTLSACAVLLFPTLADAKRGGSKGKGPAHATKGGKGKGKAPGRSAKSSKAKGPKQLVTFRLKGTALAGDPCAEDKFLAINVDHSNRHARHLEGEVVVVKVDDARLRVADLDGDGDRDLDDVAAGDSVKVQAKVPRGQGPDALLTARHVVVKHREGEPGEPDDPYGGGVPDPYGTGVPDPYGGGVPCDPYGGGVPEPDTSA